MSSQEKRVTRLEQKGGPKGIPLSAIFIGALRKEEDDYDENTVPPVPGFAFVLKGPLAGQQIQQHEGETDAEFRQRVESKT